jgi:trk system potassium uptake protein TrkA
MKIIIVGCGRLGSGLARALSQSGHAVTVIDMDASRFELLPSSFKGQKITGVGFDRDVLVEAGIERADALAAVTSSDEANAVIARIATQVFRVPRVVAQLYDQRKTEVYNRLGLQTIDSTAWGINRAAELLCFSPLNTVLSIGSGGVDIVETEVPTLLTGRKVRDMTVTGEIVVIAISRNNKTFLPSLDTLFQERDIIHIAVMASSRNRLREILGLA